MTKIAFDATAIAGEMGKGRGIGNYTLSQIRTIVEMDKENQYYLFNPYAEANIFGGKNPENFEEINLFLGKKAEIARDSELKGIYRDLIRQFIRKYEIDVFYVTSPFDPSMPVCEKSWFGNAKVVATVYDIIPYVMKEHYFKYLNEKWYMSVVAELKKYDQLFAISESVKNDMIHYLDFDPDQVTVIYGACSSWFGKIDMPEDKKKSLLNKYGIHRDYFICTGGDDVRKNIEGLIRAYGKAGNEVQEQYELVVVCKLSDASVKKYTKISQECGVADSVIFTNFVPDEDLLGLYNLASALLFPSKYEGFGLPITEAWSCGLPVLTSNNSSLGEIADGSGILVDPNEISAIADGIRRISVKTIQQEYRELGQKRLAYYTWPVVASKTIDYLKTIEHVEKAVDITKKKKIAFFTPLPPARSGISDYSVDVLGELNKYFYIDVYLDSNVYKECTVNIDGVNLFDHKDFVKNKDQYSEIIYQMGNSNFHFYMYDYIQKYPGIIVLHDYNLNGAFMEYCSNKIGLLNDKKYLKLVASDYFGEEYKEVKGLVKNGTIANNLYNVELNGFLINHAKKVIVHSNYAKEKLLAKNIARNVYRIPLYAQNFTDVSEDVSATSKDDIVRVGVFGFLHPIKRIEQIIRAIASLAHEGKKVQFYMVGYAAGDYYGQLSSIMDQEGIKDLCKYTGYTSLEDFENYVRMMDICVNLRSPNNGESSASFTRMLAEGKCVIVNDVGSFSEYPDDVCVKIPAAETMSETKEILVIKRTLNNLITDSDLRISIGKNARSFAESYLKIDMIARQYFEAIEDARVCDSVTEASVKKIEEMLKNENYSENEKLKVADTLAFVKSPA